MAQGEVIGAYGLTEPGAGQRFGRDPDDRPPRGRPRRRHLGHRRRQAVHHQRRPGGHLHRHRPDRDARRRRRRDQRVHRPGRHARLLGRPARGQARAPRLGDRRAALRRRPGPGREPARRAGRAASRRSCRSSTAAGSRSARWRSGIAQGALDASIPYAQTREQFGRPIGTFQGVAFMVADMATEIEAARGLVWRAAWLKDQGRDFGLVAAQAKLFASEVSSRVDEQRDPDPRRLRLRRPSTRSSATCATPS